MTLTPGEIKQILDALEASDWDSASVTVDGVTIAVSRNGAALIPINSAPASTAAPAEASAPAVPTGADVHVVIAPSVGVFWRSPRPGAPPFVEVGQHVAAGDTVCIVEMMKLMNNVVTDVAGTVTAIHVTNSGQVEYGDALISISTEAS